MSAADLDRAHRAMTAGGEAERRAWFMALADTPLHLMLAAEAAGETVEPALFATEEGRFALAFDSEERLAAFAEGVAEQLTLPGRVLAAMLAGQGIGLGVNLGAETAELLPAEAVGWLAEMLHPAPLGVAARPALLLPPGALPPGLPEALTARLANAAGHLCGAWLARGADRLTVVIAGAPQAAEAPLAGALAEAMGFAGIEAPLDILFVDQADPLLAQARARGHRLPLPQPPPAAAPEPVTPRAAPGMDPDRPPKLH